MSKILNIDVSPAVDGKYQVISFEGEFDKVGYEGVRDELNAALKNFKVAYLVFDFASLKFINSQGIGVLMEINGDLISRDAKLVIVGSNAHVADVFKAVGLDQVVTLKSSLKNFLADK